MTFPSEDKGYSMELKCPHCKSTKIVYIAKTTEFHTIQRITPEEVDLQNVTEVYYDYVMKPIYCRDCGNHYSKTDFCKLNKTSCNS